MISDFEIHKRVLLCFYAYYCDPAESKLTMVRGKRSYEDFKAQVMPFVLDLFDRDTALLKTKMQDVLEYITAIQTCYGGALKRLGLGDIGPQQEDEVTYESIRRIHWRLCAVDGCPSMDEDCPRLVRELLARRGREANWRMDDALTDRLYTAWKSARDAYKALEKFFLTCQQHSCTRPNCKVFLSPLQAISEIMEFLTHFSRGYRFALRGESALAEHDIEAAIGHLTRVTLDLRKSIIATAFRAAPELLSKDHALVRDVLKSRQDELSLHAKDPQKIDMYRAEADVIRNLDIFSKA